MSAGAGFAGAGAGPSGPDRRVCFCGDSFAAGVGDEAGLGWVGRLAAASLAAGELFTAYNLGVRGDTSAAVAARWWDEARVRQAPTADNRVVFAFGFHDTRSERRRRVVEHRDSMVTLADILREAASYDLPALVVGPPPALDRDRQELVARLARSFRLVADAHGVPFVDLNAALAETPWPEWAAAGDGVHPNADGHRAIADAVLAAGWLAWLRQGAPAEFLH
jgi:lysophospholipase L1-like esterase